MVAPTPEVEQLEERLATLHERRYCVLLARATTGLYHVLRWLRPEGNGRVLLPAVLCPSSANAVLYAGLIPHFVDVSLGDANIDVAASERVLAAHDDVVAILAVHLYGHPAPVTQLQELAQRYDVALLEDAAQSMGGEASGSPMGSWGVASLVSFGHTKIIDAGAGGAVLTDDSDLVKHIRAADNELRLADERTSALAQAYRYFYYAVHPLRQEVPALDDLFLPVPVVFRDLYLHRRVNLPLTTIEAGLATLGVDVAERRRRANLYRAHLAEVPEVVQFRPRSGIVPWRWSFRMVGVPREQVLDRFRNLGFDASTWYPSLHRWYYAGRSLPEETLSRARRLSEEVVNLWTSPATSLETVERGCYALLKVLREYRGGTT